EPSTPAPTYGTFASSSSPCTVPSSPNGPCRTGNTTSTSVSADATAFPGKRSSSPEPACNRLLLAGSAASPGLDGACNSLLLAPSSHCPLRSISIVTTSLPLRSSASTTL